MRLKKEQETACDWTPDTEFSVEATAELSNMPTEPTVEGKSHEQEEAKVHVNPSVANLGGKHDTRGNLAGTEVTHTHSSGPDSRLLVPLGDLLLLPADERLDQGTSTGGTAGRAPGKGEGEEKEKEGASEFEMKSFPNTQGAMSDDEPEVEVMEDDQEVQVVDMSLEDSPALAEEAGENARSPSSTPDSPTPDSPGFRRDELYETSEEAEMLLDAAEEGEEGQRSPP